MGEFSHRKFKQYFLEKDGIVVDQSKKSTTDESYHRKFNKPASTKTPSSAIGYDRNWT